MTVTLKDIIGLVKELPEESFSEALESLKEIKEKAEEAREAKPVSCIRCGSINVGRNGKQSGHQYYLCKDCSKSFSETATSAIAHSQSSESVWKQVIRDTVEGISIDKTAVGLDLSHSTVFHMRHKILCCIEQALLDAPTALEGVCEADETYVLESVKGRKIPAGYHRKSRKHGAKASVPGLSEEYICVCTSVDSDTNCTASVVNRAAPSKVEIEEVFGNRVSADTVILCDGSKQYDVLDDKCTVAHSKRINKVNGFHSFIKERLDGARGVATIYLGRYTALYSQIYGNLDAAVDKIFVMLTSRNNTFSKIEMVKAQNLLIL